MALDRRGRQVAVKVVACNPAEDTFPPKFEAKLSRLFAAANLGYKPLGEMRGLNTEVDHESFKALLKGPDFQKPPPACLHCALAWFPMEVFRETVHSFLTGRHGAALG